ncbi:MAG: cobyric acid synthase [Nitrospirales bacterium]
MPARTLMIQGTASHVGKSVLVTALCRLFLRRGLKVAPFKAQNMSNNSFVTPDGREIGRAQAVQAAACRLAPRTDFNPVLIKPETDRRAQVVVNGRVAGRLEAGEFGRIRKDYWTVARDAFDRLSAEFDLVVLEGAGSPAEINLRDHDIVNMAMAKHALAPVLLVGDIDRGGVFAALVGTVVLLTHEERRHVKGVLINKFRGDERLLISGLREIEDRLGLPCLGILPYVESLGIPQEDSLGWEERNTGAAPEAHRLMIGVVNYPAASNLTDLEALEAEPDVTVLRLLNPPECRLDAVVFPGAKSTPLALEFVTSRGFDLFARQVVEDGGVVVGLCGGYQLLGRSLLDPLGVESTSPVLRGLGLLDVVTTFDREKYTKPVAGRHRETDCPVTGYEVHMGRTTRGDGVEPLFDLAVTGEGAGEDNYQEGALSRDRLVLGSYVHGLFDAPEFRRAFLNQMRGSRGWHPLPIQTNRTLEDDLDRLADFVERHVEIKAIEAIIEQGV